VLSQVFSIAIWLWQQYYIYMYVVIALSIIAIIQAAYAEYQNLKALERLAKADGLINRYGTDSCNWMKPRTALSASLFLCGGQDASYSAAGPPRHRLSHLRDRHHILSAAW
jgi:hypothetical protein